MAYLFHIDEECWSCTELGGPVLVGEKGAVPLERVDIDTVRHGAMISRVETGTTVEKWVLLAARDAWVHVNNTPLRCGIRLLADRDAIRLAGNPPLFFSSERIARIEGFPSAESVFCPRCKLPIDEGAAAVRCPLCGVWHHQQVAEGRACWSYADTCALCNQSTDLEAEQLRWTPEGL